MKLKNENASMKIDLANSKIKSFLPLGLGFIFILEVLYYNIAFDMVLLLFMLLIAFSIGYLLKIKMRITERFIVQLASGFGILGFLIWLTTLHTFNLKSLYFISGVLIILFNVKNIADDYKQVRKIFDKAFKEYYSLIIIILLLFIIYIPFAIIPISDFDSLVKHISIPNKILSSKNWDYNVIEFLPFGDSAILEHMYYLFLLALGGGKALPLLNTIISFLILFLLLFISKKIFDNRMFMVAVIFCYASIPMVFKLSIILMVDLLPVFFLIVALMIVLNNDYRFIVKNSVYVCLISGFALFSKQHAVYIILPIFIILFISYVYHFYKNRDIIYLLRKLVSCLFLFFLTFTPVLIIIWYKTGNPFFPFANSFFQSPYFNFKNFVDPYQNSVLGFNFNSLKSIVYHPYKHTETFLFGGIGYHLLLLFFLPFLLMKERYNKAIIKIIFTIIFAYFLATMFTYNIRYYLSIIVLSVIACLYTPFLLIEYIKNQKIRTMISIVLILSLVFPNINIIKRAYSFKHLEHSSKLLDMESWSVLEGINTKDVRLLSENDARRGMFDGEFYTLSWYNTFLIKKYLKKSENKFLEQFDYLLIAKQLPLSRLINYEDEKIKRILIPYKENETHILYKIKEEPHIVLQKTFDNPIKVNVDKPVFFKFNDNYYYYRILIEIKQSKFGGELGRFQISFESKLKEDQIFLNVFQIKKDTNYYESVRIYRDRLPGDYISSCFLYLTSHDKRNIEIKSFKLMGYKYKEQFLNQELKKYNEKWPHLSL